MIANTSQFEINDGLKNAIEHRDIEYNVTSSEKSRTNFGQQFLTEVETIQLKQQELRKSFETNDNCKQLLEQLLQLFNNFVSEKIINAEDTYAAMPLFNQGYWDENFLQLPPLDKIYGRILYSIHKGDLKSAKTCTKSDCKAMFTATLPSIIRTVKSIRKAIEDLEKIEINKQKLLSQIQEIKKQCEGLEEADKCLKAMESLEFLKAAEDQGILLKKPEEEAVIFWDRFLLKDLPKLTDVKEQKFQLEGLLPHYVALQVPHMKTYLANRMPYLNEAEQKEYDKRMLLSEKVAKLALQYENRDKEITFF